MGFEVKANEKLTKTLKFREPAVDEVLNIEITELAKGNVNAVQKVMELAGVKPCDLEDLGGLCDPRYHWLVLAAQGAMAFFMNSALDIDNQKVPKNSPSSERTEK